MKEVEISYSMYLRNNGVSVESTFNGVEIEKTKQSKVIDGVAKLSKESNFGKIEMADIEEVVYKGQTYSPEELNDYLRVIIFYKGQQRIIKG